MANTENLADHRETVTGPNVNTERVKAIVTLVVTLFALANAGLNLAGVDTLPFTEDQVAAAIYSVIGVAGTIWSWWKNQNITTAAVDAQGVLDGIKANGEIPEGDTQ